MKLNRQNHADCRERKGPIKCPIIAHTYSAVVGLRRLFKQQLKCHRNRKADIGQVSDCAKLLDPFGSFNALLCTAHIDMQWKSAMEEHAKLRSALSKREVRRARVEAPDV